MALVDDRGAAEVANSYDALAPHYDAFTEHPNYGTWVRSLEALARRHGLSGRRVLDLGCGTGSSLLPLLELGYEVVGCDVSPGMLKHAASKLPADVPLLVADMRELPELGLFDLIWAVNDGLNYLRDADDLRRTFLGAAGCLRSGGILLFDVNTLAAYATLFAATRIRESEALFMAWVGSGDETPRAGQLAEARLEVFERDALAGAWRRSTSHHRQRHHPLAEIVDALTTAGLRMLAVHGLTEDAVIDETVDEHRHSKAILVATQDHRERR
ncbi:MAG TPA: class I SAM-dependent methyltransferase [Solirubrobacteraceae bacterium]